MTLFCQAQSADSVTWEQLLNVRSFQDPFPEHNRASTHNDHPVQIWVRQRATWVGGVEPIILASMHRAHCHVLLVLTCPGRLEWHGGNSDSDTTTASTSVPPRQRRRMSNGR